jgi:hypothetical protein
VLVHVAESVQFVAALRKFAFELRSLTPRRHVSGIFSVGV